MYSAPIGNIRNTLLRRCGVALARGQMRQKGSSARAWIDTVGMYRILSTERTSSPALHLQLIPSAIQNIDTRQISRLSLSNKYDQNLIREDDVPEVSFHAARLVLFGIGRRNRECGSRTNFYCDHSGSRLCNQRFVNF